jgi:hypothetical protein
MTEEHRIFLDELRGDGTINMFGARPHLMDEFGLEKHEASKVLSDWMTMRSKEKQDEST